MARRIVYWEGSAKRDFLQFPTAVQKDMGVALFVVQIGGMPPSVKPWKGLGAGVYELVEEHRGNAYRAIYAVSIPDGIHVLHAFQKKSKAGIRTPKVDVDLVARRFRAATARYQDSRSD